MKLRFVTLFILIIQISVLGQDLVYTNYTNEDGLPSLQVYDIHQDVNGFLWFATDKGICSYNGYSFQPYSTNDGITSNTVFKFFPQQNGDIWCATLNNKLFYFNPKNYQFVPYEFNNVLVQAVLNRVVNNFIRLKDGSISVSFDDHLGVVTINSEGEVVSYSLGYELNEDNVKDDSFIAVMEYVESNYFSYTIKNNDFTEACFENSSIVSTQGIGYDANHSKSVQFGEYSVFKTLDKVYLKKNNVLISSIESEYKPINVGVLDDHFFWVGYRDGGVVVYNEFGDSVSSYLSGRSITYFIKDHEGGYWFSSLSSGVFYSEDPSIKFYDLKEGNHIFQLAQDDKSRLWVSTYNRDLYLLEKAQFGLKEQSTWLIFPISSRDHEYNFTWISNWQIDLGVNTVLFKTGPRFDVSKESMVSSIDLHHDSTLILSRLNDVVKSGRGYYLGSNNGLFIYDTNSNKVRKHDSPMLSSRIEDFVKVKDEIYVATIGGGIFYNINDQVKNISIEEGLNSPFVNKLYNEGDSVLWVCTNNGVNKVSIEDTGLMVSDLRIFPNKIISDIEIINDTIWVGTWSGLYSLTKSSLNSSDLLPDYFSILEVKVNGEETESADLLGLQHYQNQLDVRFQAVSFRKSSKLFYRHKIDGLENEWNYTENTNITYPSIPYGEYKLLIEVSLNGDEWGSSRLIIPLSISPPYYKTYWFIVVLFIAFSLVVFAFFKLKIVSYNKKVMNNLMRSIAKRFKFEEQYIIVREQGKDVKVVSSNIMYVKSSGNYCEIHTQGKIFLARLKISEFMDLVPDKGEYLKIHRSCIVRVDRIKGKSNDSVIMEDVELKVSETYIKDFRKVKL